MFAVRIKMDPIQLGSITSPMVLEGVQQSLVPVRQSPAAAQIVNRGELYSPRYPSQPFPKTRISLACMVYKSSDHR